MGISRGTALCGVSYFYYVSFCGYLKRDCIVWSFIFLLCELLWVSQEELHCVEFRIFIM